MSRIFNTWGHSPDSREARLFTSQSGARGTLLVSTYEAVDPKPVKNKRTTSGGYARACIDFYHGKKASNYSGNVETNIRAVKKVTF